MTPYFFLIFPLVIVPASSEWHWLSFKEWSSPILHSFHKPVEILSDLLTPLTSALWKRLQSFNYFTWTSQGARVAFSSLRLIFFHLCLFIQGSQHHVHIDKTKSKKMMVSLLKTALSVSQLSAELQVLPQSSYEQHTSIKNIYYPNKHNKLSLRSVVTN